MDAAPIVASVACARQPGMLARAFGALTALVCFSAISAPLSAAAEPFAAAVSAAPPSAAKLAEGVRERTFAPTLGIVRAPLIPGLGGTQPQAQASGGAVSIDFTGGRLALRRAVSYRTPTGEDILVSVSARYSEDPGADRLLVDYVSSLLHSDEITGLRLMVLRGDEIGRKCGAGTAACYLPGRDTIVVVGEDRFGGLPTDYVLAHEYGHRIAHYSANPPFRGGAFWNGPKRWASHERVCAKLRRGRLSLAPSAYWNFPGENFAEAYARYHIRGQVRWQYSPALKPDAGAFEAIERDVKSPWRGSRVTDVRRRLGRGEEATFTLKTPLDGRFTADLYSQGSGRFEFELRQGARRVARSPRPTRDFRLSRLICGGRTLTLTVRAAGAGGSYRLVIDRP